MTLLGSRKSLTEEELHPELEYDKFWMFQYFYDGCVVVNAENKDKCGSWGGKMMSYGA